MTLRSQMSEDSALGARELVLCQSVKLLVLIDGAAAWRYSLQSAAPRLTPGRPAHSKAVSARAARHWQ
jgi:hypothetical protein